MRITACGTMAALCFGVVAAQAQIPAGQPRPSAAEGLTAPGAGSVAGTGLGGTSKPSGDAPGSGRSVEGPPGQGIDGQGIDGQGIERRNDVDSAPAGTR